MGVRGLSTFIKERQEKFLARHKLCNEMVLIDGDNLMYHVNGTSKGLNHAFGGDYQKYSLKVEAFLENFQRCGITPIILLDGGSDPSNRKLKTAFTRLTDKLNKTRKLEPATQHRHPCLPLLTKTTFLEVLHHLGLPHAVCPFEADEPLAALARQLNCAVISDDTDFFAFGVRSVPLRSLAEEPELGLDGQLYMDCMVFKHDHFMREYGLRPQLMPLLACLLGNDYISPATLKAFFRHVPRPFGQRRGRPAALRIRGLLAWLRRHTDPEEALEEVLSQTRKEERQALGRLVRRSMDNYSSGRRSAELLDQLQLPAELLDQLQLPDELLSRQLSAEDAVLPSTDRTGNQLYTNGDHAEPPPTCGHDDVGDASDDGVDDDDGSDDDDDGDSDDSDGDDPSQAASPEAAADGRLLLDGAPPPAWLADGLRRGLFTSDVINIISGQPLLQEPQVEDARQPPACSCVEPLLRWLAHCLHGRADWPVTLYRRADAGKSVVRRQLAPPTADAPQPPPLHQIPVMSAAERRRAVLAALGWLAAPSQASGEPTPQQATEPMSQLKRKSMTESPAEPASETMPQSMSEVTEEKSAPQLTSKLTSEAMLDALPERHQFLAVALKFWRSHASAVVPVTAAHVGALLLPERRREPGVSRLAGPEATLLSGEATFDRRLAHQLAQLQCVLAQARNVNALMGGPLEPVSPAKVLAGPLVYNAATQLRKFGLARAVEWMPEPALGEWRREMHALCHVLGVAPDLKPARPTPVPARVTAPGETKGKMKVGGDGNAGVGLTKVTKKARPQPQLAGNKFAALLQDSDCAISDDE